jgi:hypothetical protein
MFADTPPSPIGRRALLAAPAALGLGLRHRSKRPAGAWQGPQTPTLLVRYLSLG